jgi:hypothetical protein
MYGGQASFLFPAGVLVLSILAAMPPRFLAVDRLMESEVGTLSLPTPTMLRFSAIPAISLPTPVMS